MNVEEILKQVTPKRAKKEVEETKKIELPEELQKWVSEYEKIGERESVVWLLIYRIIKMVDFPVAEEKYQKSLRNSKFLLMMFFILLDDIVDKTQNEELASELLKIPSGDSDVVLDHLSEKDRKYFEFSLRIWNFILQSIKKYPLYGKYEDIFQFDILQIINSMRFALLVNKDPFLINKTEYWAYFPCSMQGMTYRMLDLMCSPSFDIEELGVIREIAWETQNMMRIANWISTWKREIKNKDYTSGVFAYLIDSGSITVNELMEKNPGEIIDNVKELDIDRYFLKDWEKHYNKINGFASRAKSLNVKKFLSQLEEIMIFHLTLRET